MNMATTLSNVPPNQVGNIVHQAIMTGARDVRCTLQPDGNWTIMTIP